VVLESAMTPATEMAYVGVVPDVDLRRSALERTHPPSQA